MTDFVYDHVSEMLVEALPELRAYYEAELRSWDGETPGHYII